MVGMVDFAIHTCKPFSFGPVGFVSKFRFSLNFDGNNDKSCNFVLERIIILLKNPMIEPE